ncbi:MAG: hypothetical protein CML16_03125 [Pusillimonas sp.]|nr:hypothetical protein [Pusillimonas sp.]MBC43579.1 hypothetical protein [Pusillimonas sp.]HCP78962.1 hypothetical protein [Pusillimonas sp.]
MQRKTPMRSSKSLKTKQSSKSRFGLAQRIAESLGRALKHRESESTVLRSVQHRRNVAALGCLITGGEAQACHVNFGKGMGLKACDSLCFPLCPELHRQHDQGGMSREERWKREWEYVDQTRAKLIRKGLWPTHVEQAYQVAIQPLARVVHPELSEVSQ